MAAPRLAPYYTGGTLLYKWADGTHSVKTTHGGITLRLSANEANHQNFDASHRHFHAILLTVFNKQTSRNTRYRPAAYTLYLRGGAGVSPHGKNRSHSCQQYLAASIAFSAPWC